MRWNNARLSQILDIFASDKNHVGQIERKDVFLDRIRQ